MSSTGRSDVRIDNDVYPTPTYCVHRLLEACPLRGDLWADPCAGDGAIIKAVNQLKSRISWEAVEIRPECEAPLKLLTPHVEITNFLETPEVVKYTTIITNPPYNLAQEFIEASLKRAETVAMLTRLNFLESRKRHALFREKMPDVYVLPDRPSFVGGKTDSTAYCWLVWDDVTFPRREGKISVLEQTDASEKRVRL